MDPIIHTDLYRTYRTYIHALTHVYREYVEYPLYIRTYMYTYTTLLYTYVLLIYTHTQIRMSHTRIRMYLRSQLRMPAILLQFLRKSLDHMRNPPVLLPLHRHTADLGEGGRHYMRYAQGTGEWIVHLVHAVLGIGGKIVYLVHRGS